MERKIKRIGLFATFLFAFVLLFAVGSKDVKAENATPFSFSEQTADFTKAQNGQVVYSKSFVADSSKMFLANCTYVEGSGYNWDNSKDFWVEDSSGNKITRKGADTSSGYQYKWEFSKNDTYTFKIRLNGISSGKYAYIVQGKLDDMPDPPTDKFESMTATVKTYSSGSYYVDVQLGALDSTDYTDYDNTCFYRENTSTGKISRIDNRRVMGTQDSSIEYATTYTYYAVKEPLVNEKIPSLGTDNTVNNMTFTASMKTALKAIANYQTVTTPPPAVGSAISLSASSGLKVANLKWRGTTVSDVSYITGYQVKRYNSKGQNDMSYNVKDSNAYEIMSKCKIPYTGKYYFTVTPYYTYKGKTYWGTATGKVGCTSRKITRPSVRVTKISNSMAKLTISAEEGTDGVVIYQKVGSKWKKIATTKKKKYTVTKNTAGKRQYRVISYVKDSGKTYYSAYSKTVKPQSNALTLKYSKYPGSYKKYTQTWVPVKVWYSNGKIKVTGRFINTHVYRLDYFVIKLTVKSSSGNQVLGTKTINSGKMKANSTKTMTVTLNKSKKNYDLPVDGIYWTYKTVKWK